MHHRGRRYHGARRLGTMKGIRTMNMSRKEFLRSGLSSMAVAGLPTTGVAAAAVAGASPAAESGPVTITTLNPTIRLYPAKALGRRSEEHTSELQSLMRISYAVFCLKKKKKTTH